MSGNALMRLIGLRRGWIGLAVAAFVCLLAEVRAEDAGFKFLEVTVVDSDGKPLADVPVEISIDEMKLPMTSDSEGMVGTNIPAGKNCEVKVRVRHEGYTAMGVGWQGAEKIPAEVTMPLAKGVTFGGVVHDEQGRPVEGVEVIGQMVWNNRRGLVKDGAVVPYLDDGIAKTDEDGRWQCTMGPEGGAEFWLSFLHPHFLNLNPGESISWDDLKSQKRIDVMDKGASLAGQVLLPTERPLPQTMVQFTKLEKGGTSMWNEIANAEGKFQFARVPQGPAIVSVQTSKYAPLKLPIEVESDMEPLEVQLESGRPIQLKLVNEAGEGLPDGRVEIVNWRFYRDNLDLGNKSEANDQGIWSWNLIPSGELTYQVSAPGYRTAQHQLVASDELQTITLKPAVMIRGRVIDKVTREPIKKFSLLGIAVMEKYQEELYLELFGDIVLNTSGDYTFQAGLLCKEFHITCKADGYENANSRLIKPDEDQVVWDFELERDPEAEP
jgi:hypothetical protein